MKSLDHPHTPSPALASVPLSLSSILLIALSAIATSGAALNAAECLVKSPDGRITCSISDAQGLRYSVQVGGKPVIASSQLGLEFKDGTKLGPTATITKTSAKEHTGTWENRFGQRRVVREDWKELRVELKEAGPKARSFGVIVRAFNDGVAFRYDLPVASGLGSFVLTKELTEFCFPEDYRCWAGRESPCAENQYPESKLSAIPTKEGVGYQCVLPLLVEEPSGYVAIAESDLRDWAGMFLSATGAPTIKAALAQRSDKNGAVVSSVPRVSPWRVVMIGRTAAALVDSDLIATLATPNLLGDVSWVKPGVAAWDPWWTGLNPNLPQYTALESRGDTRADMEYIDFAAEMGWSYQLVDWYWYKNMTSFNKGLHSPPNANLADLTQSVPEIDLPKLVKYAKGKKVGLLIWAHSLDVQTFGVEKTLAYLAAQGLSGVKIDFLNSDSQETVQWCEEVLKTAAKHRLLVDFHGTYKPTGLARTYPNFITQEGVLGNEYNKLPGNRCNALHTATLPFTRALLGPMDFTPGGFHNRAPKDFKVTAPAQVIGTRARQLAMTVLYPSPLTVMCDSPASYRSQPGVEFLKHLPTVWDETVVLSGKVGQSVVLARRSGAHWYLVAMNGDEAATLPASLDFLPAGTWRLHRFADKPDGSDYQAVDTATQEVDRGTTLQLSLAPAGGYAAILEQL